MTTFSLFHDFCLFRLCVSSDGETSLPVCQCGGTVAPTEQAAAYECVALPHSLLLQVRRRLPVSAPLQCLTFSIFHLLFKSKHDKESAAVRVCLCFELNADV